MARRLAFVLFIVVVALAAVTLAGFPRLARSARFPALRRVAQLIMPPRDLYVPLATFPLEVTAQSTGHRFRFSHRYPGLHAVSVITVPPPSVDAVREFSDFDLELRCGSVRSNRPVFLTSRTSSPEWWRRGEEGGFVLLRYEVPADLPLEDDIECEALVLPPPTRAISEYTGHRLEIAKASEE